MIYAIIGLGALFILIGILINVNNAKYLLSGYNTMSEPEREKVDSVSYLSTFRKFHIFLGISLLLITSVLYFFISQIAAGIFMTVYPLLAYLYFIWSSKRLIPVSGKGNKAAIATVIATLLLTAVLLTMGITEDELTYDSEKVQIQGWYGETIKYSEIATVALVDKLPEIVLKSNGFALGKIRKGYFKTAQDEKIKLIVNADNKPIVRITKNDSTEIYYISGAQSNQKLFKGIAQNLSESKSK